MTQWHIDWQQQFTNCEKSYPKVHNGQLKHRRSDVDLNDKLLIEFQYSPISKEEVSNRKHDYSLHNKNIIWMIHGDDTITVSKLKNSNRIFLEFHKEPWKFQSFTQYDSIYLDINSEIYKIDPNKVKSRMIDIPNPISKLHERINWKITRNG